MTGSINIVHDPIDPMSHADIFTATVGRYFSDQGQPVAAVDPDDAAGLNLTDSPE